MPRAGDPPEMDLHRSSALAGTVILGIILCAFSPSGLLLPSMHPPLPSVAPAGSAHPAEAPWHLGTHDSTATSAPTSSLSSTPDLVAKTANIGFYTHPGTCGTITFNGSTYANGADDGGASTGAWPVSTTPCVGWTQTYLNGSGGVQIHSGTAYVNGTHGNISATFTGPLYMVNITTTPASCGSVTLNTTVGKNGQTLYSSPGQFPVSATACTGFYTSSITGNGKVTVAGGVAIIGGSGGISAVFEPKSFNLTVDSSPLPCGGATIGGIPFPSDGTPKLIQAGTYAYSTYSCTGYNLTKVSTSPSNLIVAQPNPYPETGNLTVLGNGFFNLTFALRVYTLTFLDVPGTGGSIEFQGTTYKNGTSIPIDYGSFGDVLAVPAPHYQSAATEFTVTGGIQWVTPDQSIVVNASGDLVAHYVPIIYSVEFATSINACTFSKVGFNFSTFALIDSNGAQVKWGVYAGAAGITPPTCPGYTFNGFQGDGTLVGVSNYAGTVWVNGSGTVTAVFSPDWLLVSGVVQKWGTLNDYIAGANVAIFYSGSQINSTGPTGAGGSWSLRLVPGTYLANATAPEYSSGPATTIVINGSLSTISGVIIWVNTTLGLPSTPPGLAGFVSTYPGILVPIFVFVTAVAVVLLWQMQRKWSRMAPQPHGGTPGQTPGAPPPPPPPAGTPFPGGPPPMGLPPGPPPGRP